MSKRNTTKPSALALKIAERLLSAPGGLLDEIDPEDESDQNHYDHEKRKQAAIIDAEIRPLVEERDALRAALRACIDYPDHGIGCETEREARAALAKAEDT